MSVSVSGVMEAHHAKTQPCGMHLPEYNAWSILDPHHKQAYRMYKLHRFTLHAAFV